MMAQYLRIKDQYPGCLLFFRLGDFYELFFEDAVVASAVLNITLTRRGQTGEGKEVPMCGVPFHAAESYIARLIRQGHRVAICDQMETPAEAKKRGHKAVVEREVVRIVTPGTLTEEGLLDARQNNFLATIIQGGTSRAPSYSLAVLDISTGEFFCEATSHKGGLSTALAKHAPREVLISEKLQQDPALFEVWRDWRDQLTPLPNGRFDDENSLRRLKKAFGVTSFDAYGDFSAGELSACGALLDYVALTQKGQLPRLLPPRRWANGSVLEIDSATRRSLELTLTLSGEKSGSLLATIDKTVTPGGARLLAARLSAPLTDPAAIDQRLEGVALFIDHPLLREEIRRLLKQTPDIERGLGRLSLGRGGPRDLALLRDGLLQASLIQNRLKLGQGTLPPMMESVLSSLGLHEELIQRLQRALGEQLPLLTREGGFIAPGYLPQLDDLRSLRDHGRDQMAHLQQEYIHETGIHTLKIKHNNILGHYVEVGVAASSKMPPRFIHRQTLTTGVRYTTPELVQIEEKILSAADKVLAMELALFDDLVSEVLGRSDPIGRTAQTLAKLDVASGLAELAVTQRYVRPHVDGSDIFNIVQGRHPVVEKSPGENESFMANDCILEGSGQRLWLITGPNMAGKSTFLRQNALIAILAQMGSYVPATSAHIGVVDRLFSRVGAADDLARGRSTFMVEMIETAAILNQATPRSLVILDEIGRGTATYDGVSIAWATAEHLHTINQCRGLFATHYHELTALEETLPHLSCHTMAVKEWEGKVIFLHQVVKGRADRSYGIHVAQLAGMPPSVIQRAEEILAGIDTHPALLSPR
jgi:DNA mismatch repair protein MutS